MNAPVRNYDLQSLVTVFGLSRQFAVLAKIHGLKLGFRLGKLFFGNLLGLFGLGTPEAPDGEE